MISEPAKAPYERQLGHFAGITQQIAAAAKNEGETTLVVAVCGSRGMDPERAEKHGQIKGAGIRTVSDLDILIIVSNTEAKGNLERKLSSLKGLKKIPNQGRSTRRMHQPPRRGDVFELRQSFTEQVSREVDMTVLTLSEFRRKFEGAAEAFNSRARPEEITEAEMAQHAAMCGFADSRITNGHALYDPHGIFAAAQEAVKALSPQTAHILFERHIKTLVHLCEHVETDWKNVFERASDHAIVMDALIRAHYELNNRMCQPGYKNYPGDMTELKPDLQKEMTLAVEIRADDGPGQLCLIADITRKMIDYDLQQQGAPPLSRKSPGFLDIPAAAALLRLNNACSL